MSLILKGVNIPNSGQIEIIIRPHGKVFSKTRGISAEAIQIPKDHGDIKDVSDLIKAIDHAHDVVWNRDDWLDENMRGMLRDTKKRIEKLPTILAEE